MSLGSSTRLKLGKEPYTQSSLFEETGKKGRTRLWNQATMAAGGGAAPQSGPGFREALTSALTQRKRRQKCGDQRLLEVLATNWRLMCCLSATGSAGLRLEGLSWASLT